MLRTERQRLTTAIVVATLVVIIFVSLVIHSGDSDTSRFQAAVMGTAITFGTFGLVGIICGVLSWIEAGEDE